MLAGSSTLAAPATGAAVYLASDGARFYYIDTNQHINEMGYHGSNGWVNFDITALSETGAVAAPGTALAVYLASDGPRVYYIDTNQHINELGYHGSDWVNFDITALSETSALAAPGSGLAVYLASDGPRVYYADTNRHIDEIGYHGSNDWVNFNVTALAGTASLATPGTSLTLIPLNDGQRVAYADTSQHLNQIAYSGTWYDQDLTAFSNGPLVSVLLTVSGQVLAGGSGFSGVTVSLSGTTAAGTAVSRSTTSDANGNYSLAVPAGGSYTVTPSLAGSTFNPASQPFSNLSGNQTANFSVSGESTTEIGVPIAQPPPAPAPAPAPPPVLSGSATNCNDISGNWVDSVSNDWSLSQSGSAVTGSVIVVQPGCGAFSSAVQGQATGTGAFNLTITGPAADSCGTPIYPRQATAVVTTSSCSQAQANIGNPGSGGAGFLGSGGSGSGSSGTTTWSRTSSPPGLRLNVDLLNDKVSTTLLGQNKTGNLSITINGPGQTTLAQHSSVVAGASFNDSLKRTSLGIGQYGSVIATWGNTTVTVPVSFNVVGYTRFSQYNFPYESQCPANPQPAWIVYKIDPTPNGDCYYKAVSLGAKFISQTNINGTGISAANGILKSYSAGARNVCRPATTGNESETFFAVDTGGAAIPKITGKCNTVLSDGTGLSNPLVNNNPLAGSLATGPKNKLFACSDQILIVDQNDKNDLRSVQDACPACDDTSTFGAAWGNTQAHIDTFNSSQTCNPKDLGDYGNRIAIRLR